MGKLAEDTNMASKAVRKVARIAKKTGDKIKHGKILSTYIPACQARAAPPLGPQLGQVRPPNVC